jgi:hypothetical protein
MSQGLININPGLGETNFCADSASVANDPYYSNYNPLKLAAKLNAFACNAVADAYTATRYGTITTPERIIALTPPPSAPKTAEEMRTWNPDALSAADAAAYEKWKADAISLIQADEASGAYRPSGNPLDVLGAYKWPVLIGAGALALLMLVKK